MIYVAPNTWGSRSVYHTDKTCRYLKNIPSDPIEYTEEEFEKKQPHLRECEVCKNGDSFTEPSHQAWKKAMEAEVDLE